MDVCSQAGVHMCCSGVRATLLERRRHRAIVFYLRLCMFSCNITGTWSKSNGPIVCSAYLETSIISIDQKFSLIRERSFKIFSRIIVPWKHVLN